jgi:hypothetical protein
MGDEYKRRVKDTVEESIELLGYCLLLIAAIETWCCIARLARGERRRDPQRGAASSSTTSSSR